MIKKAFDLDAIRRDVAITKLFIEDKLERAATHSMGRAVASQMASVFEMPMSKAILPPEVRIGALQDVDERRVVLECGTAVVVNSRTESVEPVFPPNWSPRQHLFSNHTIDRGSTGAAWFYFAVHSGLLWSVHWGPYHDMWNAIKGSAKALKGWWKSILQFAAISNQNHGPFRSGAWGRRKQETLTAYVASHTSRDAEFREAAVKQAVLSDRPIPRTDAEFEAEWAMFGCIRSCCEAGPILKMARWMSIEECWDYYRKEIYLLRVVLAEMSPEKQDVIADRAQTAMLDSEFAASLTSKSGGLLKKCPYYITENLVDTLEMFSIGTAATRKYYKYRTTTVKSPSDGTTHDLFLLSGGWEVDLLETISDSLYSGINLNRFGAYKNDDRAARNSRQMVSFTLHVVTERAIRALPQIYQYPKLSVGLLHPKPRRAANYRTSCLSDFKLLEKAESAAVRGNEAFAMILRDIWWRNSSVVRLFIHLLAREQLASDDDGGALFVAKDRSVLLDMNCGLG